MAGDKLIRKPSIAVIQGDSEPMYGVVAAGATVTYLKPGVLVKYSTNDGEIDIAGATDISGNLGIIGYEYTPDEYRPATRDTAYAVGDHVAVHAKPGMRFRGHLVPSSTAVTPGTPLCHRGDASGNLEIFLGDTSLVAGTGHPRVVAMALESVTPLSTYAGTVCWMEWL
jgi:hypothetical protein